ncbi:helix-turn-helix domain-containing protein [Pendulispora albinea]|uniref:Helix-turn-helix domain-containing protein n=1 Tax=Pendulispora albinea TaxID=2741071 RepID=A0ABZ2MC76_9BACT
MHFGATLRLLRMHTGLSLRELAERIGVSNAYLSRVENGHDGPPTPDRLATIARELGVPPATLIELADKVGSLATDYLERVPAARALLLEIFQRDLGPMDLARIKAFVEREFPMPGATRAEALAVRAMLSPSRAILGLSCSDIDDAIDVASARLASPLGLSAAELGERVRRRERECATCVGGGLAVPHAVMPGAPPCAAVVTLRRPLLGDTPDGRPLRMFLVHVHPGGPQHARLLAYMARWADEDVVAAACAERDAGRLIAQLVG